MSAPELGLGGLAVSGHPTPDELAAVLLVLGIAPAESPDPLTAWQAGRRAALAQAARTPRPRPPRGRRPAPLIGES